MLCLSKFYGTLGKEASYFFWTYKTFTCTHYTHSTCKHAKMLCTRVTLSHYIQQTNWKSTREVDHLRDFNASVRTLFDWSHPSMSPFSDFIHSFPESSPKNELGNPTPKICLKMRDNVNLKLVYKAWGKVLHHSLVSNAFFFFKISKMNMLMNKTSRRNSWNFLLELFSIDSIKMKKIEIYVNCINFIWKRSLLYLFRGYYSGKAS